jgi:hypothetical protein
MSHSDEARASAERALSPTRSDDPLSLAPNRRRTGEGGMMPFDMDVPVAYGSVTAGAQMGLTDMSSGSGVATATGMGVVVEEGDQSGVVDVARDTNAMMENIETERVPCPRLCGATFGSGNGGLAIFHNGDVKKMWSWYQRADAIRLSTGATSGVKGDAAFSDADSIGQAPNPPSSRRSHPLSPEVEGSTKQQQTVYKSGPRTLKELMNMTATAKEVRSCYSFYVASRFLEARTHIQSTIPSLSIPAPCFFSSRFCRHNGEKETARKDRIQKMLKVWKRISSKTIVSMHPIVRTRKKRRRAPKPHQQEITCMIGTLVVRHGKAERRSSINPALHLIVIARNSLRHRPER